MSEHSFKGGIHPPERKELTERSPIAQPASLPKTVSIPVTMGGAPNKPVVEVGAEVARGQVIAENPEAFMGVPVHASIAGKVKAIGVRQVIGNPEQVCVTIEDDGSSREAFMPVLDPSACSREEALKRVKDAGLVGMGGAAFPTHVKLNPPKGKTIEYVIANAAECEPYLTVDKHTMEASPDRFIDGISIAMHITGAPKGIVALEENKKDLVPVLEKAIAEKGAGKITIVICKTKYPQGGEKNIVQATVGREIPSGGLPADIGCVIQNVGTLCALSDAFRLGKPLVDRALTVSGLGLEDPQNIVVPIGTVIKDLEGSAIHPKTDEVVKIIAGGPMMGTAMPHSDFPVGKNTSGVLYLTAGETRITEETPCLGCGRCTEACSCRLTPVMIVRSLKAENTDLAIKFGLLDCVECGACAYVCPARVNLVQHFRIGKALVRQQRAAADAKAKAAATTVAGSATAVPAKGGN